MNQLTSIDYWVIGTYLLLIFVAGMAMTRKASDSVDDFFLGGRHIPWWLLGISMAATNFSIDTPIAITKFVATEGIAGVWFFWASAISALLVAFLFARLWRRSGVMTDAEIIEQRYAGKPAAALRLFKGFYFGILFNAFIMGWVFLALIKVLTGVTGLDVDTILIVSTTLVFIYTTASGFYGVVVTDFIQYFIALTGSIILAVFAWDAVGGSAGINAGLAAQQASHLTDFIPDYHNNIDLFSLFLTYILVQWWAHKYADGGGKHIQRMLAAKNETQAFTATIFYAFINYAIQVWPWIITALASVALFGQLNDPELAYPMMMAKVLPAGLLGLVLAGLIGAFMSTIDTHLNLGSSYMINDIYRRFLVKNATQKHYVMMSRLMMAGLLGLAVLLALNMDSVAGAWKFLLTFAAGAGPVWILRWYWWRINAWSEFSAMIASGIIATWLAQFHADWFYNEKLLTTIGLTAVVWLPVTLLTAPTQRKKLQSFVEKIRPGGPGWNSISRDRQHKLGKALLNWLMALAVLFGFNFALGGWLLGKTEVFYTALAIALLASFGLWRQLSQQRSI